MKKIILFSAIIAVAISSCKDKEKDQPKPGTPALTARQTLMIGKDWKIHSLVYGGIDITSMIEPCVKDNIAYHFNDATTGYTDEGPTKCETSDPQRANFTWTMTNNESRLIVTASDNEKDTFNIVSVTATELKLGQDNNVVTLKN